MNFSPPPPLEVEFIAEWILCNEKLQENPSEALNYCEAAYRLKPSRSVVESLMNAAFMADKRDVLKQLIRKLPEGSLQRIEAEALLSFLSFDYPKFTELGEKALERGTENVVLLITLNAYAAKTGMPNLFKQSLKRLYEIYPQNDKLFEILLKVSTPEERIKLLEQRLERKPSKKYLLELVKLLNENGEREKALRYLQKGLEYFPSLGGKYIGELLLLGRTEEAYRYAERTGDLDTFYDKAFEVAELYGNAKLLRFLEEKLLEHPSEKYLGRLLLDLMAFNFDAKEVGRVGEEFLKVANLKNPASREVAEAYAVWSFLHGNSLPPTEFETVKKLVELAKAIKENKLDTAEHLFAELKGKLKGYPFAVYKALKPYFYYKKGFKPSKLFETFTETELLTSASELYDFDRKYAEDILRAYLTEDNSPKAFSAVFQIAYDHGDISFISQIFRKAVQLYPDNPHFLNAYAYTLLELKGREATGEACPLLEKAYKLSKDNGAIADSLAWCYYLEGKIDRAYRLLKKLNKKGEPVLEYHFAEVLRKRGKPCEALKFVKSALEDLNGYPKPPEPGLKEKLQRLEEELKNLCGSHSKSNL